MKMSEEQQKLLIEKLESLWPKKICPVCNQDKWQLDDTLFQLIEFPGQGKIVTHSTQNV